MTPRQNAQDEPRAELGVIGGSGLYALLEEVVEVRVETPYGPP
ncbi:5'-methylthioadenosine phosphorylase, partial [Kitasatospora sp. NPDC127059]